MVNKVAHYLMCKGGVYYFTRHVPNDLQRYYERPRIVICLKTHSKNAAVKASNSIASKLDDFWLKMRISQMGVPAAELLIKEQKRETYISYVPKLSDALNKYCRLKGTGRSKEFFSAANRNVGSVIERLGDRPIDAYSSSDAAIYRDWLLEKNLTASSVKRMFGTIRAVFTLMIQEEGLGCQNPFSRTYLPPVVEVKRNTVSPKDMRRLQVICLEIADERRLLLALLSDTGMRLSEALGLIWSDIHIDCEYPYLSLKPHPWRPLKTSGSKRIIPLVGAAYDAIKIMHQQRTSQFLFNSYSDISGCNGNSCSAALNKWLKKYISDAVIHSFRHSFRDRLRNAGMQSEMIDCLGGWSNPNVGQRYGMGYNIEILTQNLKNAIEDHL